MAVRDIVIIEDDPKDEKLMLRAFRKINLKNPLIILRDGEEALEFFQARGRYSERNPQELPAVVMLDLKLPKVDGLQVLEALRADPTTQKLPIVILTSSDEQTDKLKSYGLGANSYVRKPIDFADFCEAVAQLGIYWTMLNEPLELE